MKLYRKFMVCSILLLQSLSLFAFSPIPKMPGIPSTIDIDTSKLVAKIKKDKLADDIEQRRRLAVKPPQSIRDDEFIAKFNFGLQGLSKSLKSVDKDVGGPVLALPTSKTILMFLPNDRYKVLTKSKDAPRMLPHFAGKYSYKIMKNNLAEISLIPNSSQHKGEVYRLLLNFDKAADGKFEAELYRSLSTPVKTPVDYKRILHITDQSGVFEIKKE